MIIAFDVETTGYYPYYGDKIFAYAYAWLENDNVKYIVRRLKDHSKKKILEDLNWLFNSELNIVMHNAKFDLSHTINLAESLLDFQLAQNIINTKGFKFEDTSLMSRVLYNDHPSHSLENLAWHLANYPKDIDAKIKKFKGKGFENVPKDLMIQYQKADVERTLILYYLFKEKMSPREWGGVYELEKEVIKVSISMERWGIMVNIPRLNHLIKSLEDQVQSARKKLFDFWGDVNVNSTPQLYRALKGKGILHGYNVPMTAKNNPSLRKEVLEDLRKFQSTNGSNATTSCIGPIGCIDSILLIKSYENGITYLKQYKTLALTSKDDLPIIHPTLNTCQAVTARQSCSHPNLQNVSKSKDLKKRFPVPSRKVFRPRPGYIFLFIDYQGIELRLLVHYSKDKRFQECINSGGDCHGLAAEVFFEEKFLKSKGDLRSGLRYRAKQANFAVAYGGGVKTVSGELMLEKSDTLKRLKEYKRTFPGFANFTNKLSKQVRKYGFVKTFFGRKVHTPPNKAYMGTNYLIQSTAAEVLKHAEVRLHKFNQEYYPNVHLIEPVHDEIIFEYPRSELVKLNQYIKSVEELMTDFDFDVPLEIECSLSTSSWEEKKEYQWKS